MPAAPPGLCPSYRYPRPGAAAAALPWPRDPGRAPLELFHRRGPSLTGGDPRSTAACSWRTASPQPAPPRLPRTRGCGPWVSAWTTGDTLWSPPGSAQLLPARGGHRKNSETGGRGSSCARRMMSFCPGVSHRVKVLFSEGQERSRSSSSSATQPSPPADRGVSLLAPCGPDEPCLLAGNVPLWIHLPLRGTQLTQEFPPHCFFWCTDCRLLQKAMFTCCLPPCPLAGRDKQHIAPSPRAPSVVPDLGRLSCLGNGPEPWPAYSVRVCSLNQLCPPCGRM